MKLDEDRQTDIATYRAVIAAKKFYKMSNFQNILQSLQQLNIVLTGQNFQCELKLP